MNSSSEQSDQNPYQPSDTGQANANSANKRSRDDAYWAKSLKIVGVILLLWAFVSLGCGILFRNLLDSFSVGGAPFGFWMAQQGSIIVFLLLLIVYMFLMNWLDREHGFGDEGKQ